MAIEFMRNSDMFCWGAEVENKEEFGNVPENRASTFWVQKRAACLLLVMAFGVAICLSLPMICGWKQASLLPDRSLEGKRIVSHLFFLLL